MHAYWREYKAHRTEPWQTIRIWWNARRAEFWGAEHFNVLGHLDELW